MTSMIEGEGPYASAPPSFVQPQRATNEMAVQITGRNYVLLLCQYTAVGQPIRRPGHVGDAVRWERIGRARATRGALPRAVPSFRGGMMRYGRLRASVPASWRQRRRYSSVSLSLHNPSVRATMASCCGRVWAGTRGIESMRIRHSRSGYCLVFTLGRQWRRCRKRFGGLDSFPWQGESRDRILGARRRRLGASSTLSAIHSFRRIRHAPRFDRQRPGAENHGADAGTARRFGAVSFADIIIY
jgi:hypothetical protein